VQCVAVEVECHLGEAFGQFTGTASGIPVPVGFDDDDALFRVGEELPPHLRRDRRCGVRDTWSIVGCKLIDRTTGKVPLCSYTLR